MGGFWFLVSRRFFRGIRAVAVFIVIFAVLLLSSCRETRTAYDIMNEFRLAYGIERAIFSPTVPEGEAGYCPEGFLDEVFGNVSDSVADYAILFISDISTLGECAILICYSTYDAISVSGSAFMRLDFLRSQAGSLDASSLDTAFVRRCGKAVILCALPDNERASRLFDKLF